MNTDPSVVRDLFVSHYFIFAFLTSLGTLQIAVVNADTRGLWLTPHRVMTRWLGVVLILTAIAIFFLQPLWVEGPWAAGSVEADSLTRDWGKASWDELAGARNVNDIHGGLDGVKQAIWFPLAAILAFFVSTVVGSLSIRVISAAGNAGAQQSTEAGEEDGLAGLANRSYFSNLPRSYRNYSSDISGSWRNGVAKADRWSLMKIVFGKGDSST